MHDSMVSRSRAIVVALYFFLSLTEALDRPCNPPQFTLAGSGAICRSCPPNQVDAAPSLGSLTAPCICDRGFEEHPTDGTCVQCVPGKFHNDATKLCQSCTGNTFAAFSGQLVCEPCPTGQSCHNAVSDCTLCTPVGESMVISTCALIAKNSEVFALHKYYSQTKQ